MIRSHTRRGKRENHVSLSDIRADQIEDCRGVDTVEEEEELSLMAQAVRDVSLTETERVILEKFVECDGNKAEVARHVSMTRAGVGYVVVKVRAKVAAAMKRREPVAA